MNELFGIPMDRLVVVLAVLRRRRSRSRRGTCRCGIGCSSSSVSATSPRRRGRTALIIVGLMLGTTIIAAALTTGDTMSHTIRATSTKVLGETDEVISARGAAEDISGELGQATGTGYFDAQVVERIESALAPGLTDGVTGAIIEEVALQAPATRQTEPTVILFAPDPARMKGFAAIRDVDGGNVSLSDLGPREIYLNDRAASDLRAESGDPVMIFVGETRVAVRVREVVHFDGAGTADAALLVPLDRAQTLLGKQGRIKHVLVSNRGEGNAPSGSRTKSPRPCGRPLLRSGSRS